MELTLSDDEKIALKACLEDYIEAFWKEVDTKHLANILERL